MDKTIARLICHSLDNLRWMQDQNSEMFQSDKWHGTLEELQARDRDLANAVGMIAWPENYEWPPYYKDFEQGERLYEKIRWGGTLKLITFAGDLQVDVKVLCTAGVKGLAVKKPGARWPVMRVQSPTYIQNYLAQFRIRD